MICQKSRLPLLDFEFELLCENAKKKCRLWGSTTGYIFTSILMREEKMRLILNEYWFVYIEFYEKIVKFLVLF